VIEPKCGDVELKFEAKADGPISLKMCLDPGVVAG
jgi:hypothetical protein